MTGIDDLLKMMVSKGGSDLHLSVGKNPMLRISGQIEPVRQGSVDQRTFDRWLSTITPPAVWQRYCDTGDGDFAYEIEGVARYRGNIFRQEHGSGAVFRIIPTDIMSLETLGVPTQVSKLVEMNRGLVLVTGPTGSGKSTTLAAIIDAINRRRGVHVITIEEPIEFVHGSKRALITQREVGEHAASFAAALQAAVREDPDVILVGEMRDLETVRMALHSAETGVLVFGTLHTNGAAKAIDRIINIFPVDEQDSIRSNLAQNLRSVLAQQLVPKVGGGRVAAFELLFSTAAASNLIREGKSHMLTSLIQTGSRHGMLSMDTSLRDLVEQGTITAEQALSKAINKDEFRKLLMPSS